MDHSNIARRDFFYVGGEYAGSPGREVMHGQMYVEALTPTRAHQPYPLVLFHGAGQTATSWLATPDGRPGWAEYFVGQGYRVYLIDQPARGRSAWQPSINGELTVFSAAFQEWLLTASAADPGWPQAIKHTQWPGEGRRGDEIFDAFHATQVPFLADPVETQRLVLAAGIALLERVGPAVLLTHSQAGTFGWLLGDARPDLVKAIVAVEPAGPPFENTIVSQGPSRAWGVADLPVAYDPPSAAASELEIELQEEPDHPDLIRCWQQKAPARRLANLAGIPVAIVTGEASYHAAYDHCTAKYLAAAGVKVTFLRLEDCGLRGNGHMVMLEKNNLEVAAVIADWLGVAAPSWSTFNPFAPSSGV